MSVSGAAHPPTQSYYARLMALSERYKYPMMSLHYAFLGVSAGLVCGMAAQVAITKKTRAGVSFSIDSVMMTAIYTGLSAPVWLIASVFCIWKGAYAANESFWDRLKLTKKIRFWWWLLVINGTSLAMWAVITTLFWDVTWICWIGLGSGADLNPYESDVCDQLTNIWFYAAFVVCGVFVNLYLVVDDNMKLQFASGEDTEVKNIENMNFPKGFEIDYPYNEVPPRTLPPRNHPPRTLQQQQHHQQLQQQHEMQRMR
ncbi:hypothetical protein HDU84_002567 [Entophlyctis sp. JEL0112]|nr:hypothetical protein HDU84_002567 [Entophlyctis sp. JEL0112]